MSITRIEGTNLNVALDKKLSAKQFGPTETVVYLQLIFLFKKNLKALFSNYQFGLVIVLLIVLPQYQVSIN